MLKQLKCMTDIKNILKVVNYLLIHILLNIIYCNFLIFVYERSMFLWTKIKPYILVFFF